MPCGGIYPIKGSWVEEYFHDDDDADCFYCGKTGDITHFCEEWDCYLHKDCIGEFLNTDEGQVVVNHEHEIIVEWENG